MQVYLPEPGPEGLVPELWVLQEQEQETEGSLVGLQPWVPVAELGVLQEQELETEGSLPELRPWVPVAELGVPQALGKQGVGQGSEERACAHCGDHDDQIHGVEPVGSRLASQVARRRCRLLVFLPHPRRSWSSCRR